MSTSEVLEVGTMFGAIVGAWFALVGWKLVPLFRPGAAPPVPPGT